MSRPLQAGLAGAAVARSLGLIALAEALAQGIGLAGDQNWTLITALALFGAASRGAAALITPRLTARMASDVAARQRLSLLSSKLSHPHARGDVDDVALASRGLRDMTPYFTGFIPAAVNSAIIPVFLLVRIVLVDWPSALVIALTLPLVPVFMILIGKYTAERTSELSAAVRRLTETVAELARGLSVLVSLGRARQQRRGLAAVSREYTDSVMQSLRVAFLSSLALELIATMSVALVAVVIGLRLIHGDMTLYAGLVALILAPECYTPLREVGQAFHAAEDGQLALKRAEAVVEEHPVQETASSSANGSDVARVEGDLLRGERLLVPGLDLRIPAAPGLTALAGPSGCGKSTLLALLSGAERGDHEDAPVLRGSLFAAPTVMMPQAPVFLRETPLEEVGLYGGEHLSSEGAREMLQALGLGHLAERSIALLSPGEQRRLAVIRTLAASDAQGGIPVLADEPTSQLDAESARAVISLLEEAARGRAVVVVTHDREVMERADRVITLVPGGSGEDARTGHVEPVDVPSLAPTAAREESAAEAGTAADGDGAIPHLLTNRHVRQGLLLAVISACSAAALTALSGWLIVRASQQPAIMYLSVAIVGVRAFGLFRAASRYAERLATHRGMLAYAADLRLRLWDALAESPAHWRTISRQDGGTTVLVTAVDAVRDAAPRALVPAVSAAAVSLGSLIAFALLSTHMLWIPVASLVISGIGASLLTMRADARATSAMTAHDAWLSRTLTQLYRAAPDLLLGRAWRRAADEFARRDAEYGDVLRRAEASRGLGALLVVIGQGLAALAVLWAARGMGESAPAHEVLAALALLQIALMDPYIALLEAIPQWRSWQTNRRALENDLRAERDTAQADARTRCSDLLGHGADALELAYTNGPRIGPVTFRGTPEAWTLITGPSGSGKSTLLDALAGFKRPEAGQVISRIDGQWVQAPGFGRVMWCGQDAYLFDAPVSSNLRLALPEATDDQIRSALQLVGLPGMDPEQPAGPGGTWLSGGERQRVAIARGLLAGADVFLLDEPTAHVDHDGAARLVQDLSVALAGRTVIVVAHRDFAELAPQTQMRTVTL